MSTKRIVKVRYGHNIRPPFSNEAARVLVGKKGRKIVSKIRKLEHAFSVNSHSDVRFLHGIKATKIDEGAHGKIYLFDNASLVKLGLKKTAGPFILKIYKKLQKTDGITQYVSTLMVFNYLKKIPLKHVLLKPSQIYAAGTNFLVSRFVNKPTIALLLAYFRRKRNPEEAELIKELAKKGIRESELYSMERAAKFIKKQGLTEEMIRLAYNELAEKIKQGKKMNYKAGILSDFDLKTKNFFVHGVKNGKVVLSVFDQGTYSIPYVLKRLETIDSNKA